MRIASARFLSDSTHCLMVTSKSVGRTTASDPISCYGSRQTFTSPSDSALRRMRIVPARFLSDTTHCLMVTSKSVGRTTASDPISCYGNRQTLISPSDSVLRQMRIAPARFLSDSTHCLMVTSKSVGRTTASGPISCHGADRLLLHRLAVPCVK